jgi:hypothetical protein
VSLCVYAVQPSHYYMKNELLKIDRATTEHDAMDMHSPVSEANSKVRKRGIVEVCLVKIRTRRGCHGWKRQFLLPLCCL